MTAPIHSPIQAASSAFDNHPYGPTQDGGLAAGPAQVAAAMPVERISLLGLPTDLLKLVVDRSLNDVQGKSALGGVCRLLQSLVRELEDEAIAKLTATGGVPEGFLQNKRVNHAFVNNYANNLKHVQPPLNSDPDIVMAAIQSDPTSLKFAGDSARNNQSLVLAAVSGNGLALRFASDALKNDIVDVSESSIAR